MVSSGPLHLNVRKRNKELGFSKSPIWVESVNFYGGVKARNSPFLVIGFDTEYKTPSESFDRQDLEAGLGRNILLSYQVHCKLYDPNIPNCSEWGGICYPEDGSIDNRLSLAEVLTFAIWKGISTGAVKAVPQMVYLVGHFTRADVPAFSDFQNLTQMMSSVRNTFLSIDGHISVDIPCASRYDAADTCCIERVESSW